MYRNFCAKKIFSWNSFPSVPSDKKLFVLSNLSWILLVATYTIFSGELIRTVDCLVVVLTKIVLYYVQCSCTYWQGNIHEGIICRCLDTGEEILACYADTGERLNSV
jgi:hypothetical protein